MAPLPLTSPSDRVNQLTVPKKQYEQGTAGSPRVFSLEISHTLFGSFLGRDRAIRKFQDDFTEGRLMRVSKFKQLMLVAN